MQSLSAKPETKPAYTQYSAEDTEITESSKVIVAKSPRNQMQVLKLHHRQNPVLNRKQVRETNENWHQINRRQDKQKTKNDLCLMFVSGKGIFQLNWLGLDVLSLVGPTGVQLIDVCCSSVRFCCWVLVLFHLSDESWLVCSLFRFIDE